MNPKAEPLPFDVGKIAVVRANGIGDYVFVLPALASLRVAFPDAEIVLLGQQWHVDFLKGRPGPVDRVIALPVYPGVGAPEDAVPCSAEIDDFFAAMRDERFDLALQLHGGGRYSNPFTRRLGARLTAGLRAQNAVPLDRWLPYVYFQSEILRYLETVSLVGASPVSLQPRLEITEEDVAESALVVPSQDNRPLVVLHPGATDPRRRWAPARFAVVGDTLARHGLRVIVTGSPPEKHLIESVTGAMQLLAETASTLSLGGFAGLLSRAQLLVSNDSGPLHLAGAVGAKTVGLYWCANLITASPAWRFGHRPVVSWRLNCPVCERNTIYDRCNHETSLVDDIEVPEVTAHCLELLETVPVAESTPRP